MNIGIEWRVSVEAGKVIVFGLGVAILLSSAAYADDVSVQLSPDELQSVTRACEDTTHRGAERTICFRDQTQKMIEEKKINADNKQMEQITNQELGAHPD